MKKQHINFRLRQAIESFLHYWYGHAATHEAIEKAYIRTWRENEHGAEYIEQILIEPEGGLFRIIHRHFVNGNLLREESYPATYGWQSNGHLIALGIVRFLVFDPKHKRLLVEDCPEQGDPTVEIFHQI